jgi:ABC-type phosphate transport system substrate-binding protein
MVKVRNQSLWLWLLVAACLVPPGAATSQAGWLAQLEGDSPETIDAPEPTDPGTLPPGPDSVPPEQPSFNLPSELPADATLAIEGSASMEAITDALVQQFQQMFANTQVTLTEQPSEVALANLQAGEADVAAIGRSLTDEQLAQGLIEVPVSREKIAVIVSPDNPFQGQIEAEDFVRIFRGELTNWVELGGPDLPIRFIDRPETSDTRVALGEYDIFNGDLSTGGNVVQVPNDSTAEVVAALGDNGVGYAIASQVIDQTNVRVLGMHNTLPDDPRYPYSQPRNYVYTEASPLAPEAEAFLALATNAQGQAAVAQAKAAEAAAVAAADLADQVNAVRPNGEGFVTGDPNGNLAFWNMDGTSAGETVAAHTGPVTALAFSADGQRLISGGADGTIRFWDAVGNPVGDPINAGNGPVTSLTVKPDGSFVSASADGTIQPWDSMGNPAGAPITGHTDTVRDMAVSSDGNTLITASDDGSIRRWNAQDGAPIGEPLTGHQGAVRAVAVKPDGRFFSGGADATVRSWNADGSPTAEPVPVSGPVNAIATNAEGTNIAVGDETGAIQYLSGEGLPVGPPVTDVGAAVDDLAFTPDGERLVVTAGDAPQLRDGTGQIVPIPTTEEASDGATPATNGLPPELLDLWEQIKRLPPQVLWIIPVAVLGLLLWGLLSSFRRDEEDEQIDDIGGLPETAVTPTLPPDTGNVEVDAFVADDFAVNETGPIDTSLTQAKQMLAEGVQLGKTGQYQASLDCFNKAIEMADLERLKAAAAGTTLVGATTVIARGLAGRGTAFANLDRNQEALSSLNRALEMDPNNVAAWIGKGNVLAQLGQLDEALFCFDKAIELNSSIAAAWQGKGKALQKMGREAEARKCFAKADELGGVAEDIPIDLGTPAGSIPIPSDITDSNGDYPATPPATGFTDVPMRPSGRPPGPSAPATPPDELPSREFASTPGITPGPIPTDAPPLEQPVQPDPSTPIGHIGITPPEVPIDPSVEVPPNLLAALEDLPDEGAVIPTPPQPERPSRPIGETTYPPMGSSSGTESAAYPPMGSSSGNRPGIAPPVPPPPPSRLPSPPVEPASAIADTDLPDDVQEALVYLPDEPDEPDPDAPMVDPIAVPPEVLAIMEGDSDIPAKEETPEETVADPMAEFFGNDPTVSMRPPAAKPVPAPPPNPSAAVVESPSPTPDEGIDPALEGLPPEVLEALRGIPADSPDSFGLS